jgi:hypothetical protein
VATGLAVVFIVIRFRRWRMVWLLLVMHALAFAKAYRRVVAATTI